MPQSTPKDSYSSIDESNNVELEGEGIIQLWSFRFCCQMLIAPSLEINTSSDIFVLWSLAARNSNGLSLKPLL